jgi:hypothetical protein
MFNEWIGDD